MQFCTNNNLRVILQKLKCCVREQIPDAFCFVIILVWLTKTIPPVDFLCNAALVCPCLQESMRRELLCKMMRKFSATFPKFIEPEHLSSNGIVITKSLADLVFRRISRL